MKKVAGTLRLALSQYRDLEAFAAFASDLDAASRAQLDRGARMIELLKQPQFSPFSIDRQVASIWAGTTGQLDEVPVADIRRFEDEFLEYLTNKNKGTLDTHPRTGQLSDDDLAVFKDAITAFKRSFTDLLGPVAAPRRRPWARWTSDDVGQETHHQGRRRPSHGRATPDLQAADQVGQVDGEDHAGAGAHRVLAHHQGAAAHRRRLSRTPRRSPARSPRW